jgi:hypothetical protein
MNKRGWIFLVLFGGLGLTYVLCFTEWVRPAPIEILPQVRFAIQPPRFKGPVKQPLKVKVEPGQTQAVVMVVKTNRPAPVDPLERVGQPEKGTIDPAPGGVANVTFTFDGIYQLTRIRVEDVPADGSRPKVFWQLTGKSHPLNSLLYSRDPEGMQPILAGAKAEPLLPEVPYRLYIQAGRRKGSVDFKTVAIAAPQ